MANILVVEDDEFFRVALKDILSRHGYIIHEAANGESAKRLLKVRDYDLILSDIRMPHLNGIELLTWIKNHKQTPTILMTGFSSILETKQAYELGAASFLTKPFTESELLGALVSVLKPGESVAESSSEDFCKIGIDEFIAGDQIPFSVYVLLGDNKYIRIASKGENISADKIKLYKEKQVNYLYVKSEDFAKLTRKR